MNKNELYHFGVKGMRWGRRKTRPKSQRTTQDKNTAQKKPRMSTAKKIGIGIAATAAVVGSVYGARKLSQIQRSKKIGALATVMLQKKRLDDFNTPLSKLTRDRDEAARRATNAVLHMKIIGKLAANEPDRDRKKSHEDFTKTLWDKYKLYDNARKSIDEEINKYRR